MDTSSLISILHESLFVIVVFVGFLIYSMIKGRQALINIIMGLYLALLVTLKFPYFDAILGNADSAKAKAILMVSVFAIFSFLTTWLFSRLMPQEWDEGVFESFGKKLLFALAGTILVMAYSYHALPITELIDPGSPIQYLFSSESSFFWWLLVPLVVLFML